MRTMSLIYGESYSAMYSTITCLLNKVSTKTRRTRVNTLQPAQRKIGMLAWASPL